MINESKLFYSDIYDNFELVYVFTDPEKDNNVAEIYDDGTYDIFDEDELAKDQIKEIKQKAKENKSNALKYKVEQSKNFMGWFILINTTRGDLNNWKMGELVKASKSDKKGYVFIEIADVTLEGYDDIEENVFKNNFVELDPNTHEKQYNYLKKLEREDELQDWEKIK